ncbi:MAG: transglycosylase domain-containing protein [Ktedonobacteraceae bacterium]
MSNNYWQSQNNQNGHAGPENPPRKSGLLSNYGGQQPGPGNSPAPQGPPPSSPFPSAPSQGNQPAPYRGQSSQQLPPPQQQPQWNGPTFMAGPVQMAQRFSAKMAAMRRTGQPSVDPNPMVRYHHGQQLMPPSTKPVPTRATPWRRSRVQRITHLRKRRLERWHRNGPGSKRLSTIILAAIAGLLIVMLTSSTGYAYNFYQSELPQVQNLANHQISQSTHIYDRHGVLLYTLYQNTQPGDGGRGTPIAYTNLPGVLQDAQVAAEDPTFWSNNGIDPQGMLRALSQLASNDGQPQSGGSTITQQLIKNLSNQRQDSLQRKANEATLAIGLTEQYPKWKILEMYFNVTPYGAQDQGVEAAVQDYFGIQPQCDLTTHKCIPATAFLDRDISDLTKCKNPGDISTCPSDPILALTRAALLAGIPQNPTHNDPTVSTQTYQHVMQVRLPYVLQQMQADGMSINLGLGDPALHTINKGLITDDIIAQVEKTATNMKIIGFHQAQLAPHFVRWVIDTLSTSLGNGDAKAGYQLLLTGGFNIYTTLDLNLEQFVEKDTLHNLRDHFFQDNYTGYGPLNTKYNVNDSATTVMDAKTGEILAMDGSADYNDSSPAVSGQVNAALALRQPASSMKPFVYAAAFEKGWYPGMRVIDDKTYFPTGNSGNLPVTNSRAPIYQPTDYGNTYHHVNQSIRINLANSFNIPAIKALMFAGFDSVIEMARRLGITDIDTDLANWNKTQLAQDKAYTNNTLSERFGPGIAIGSAEISDLQMVGGYQVFADNGIRVPYHNILDIYDNYGHNLYHYDPTHPNGTQVLSPQIAFMINSMLSDDPSRDVYEFAGIKTLTMSNWHDQPVAAKTGTSNGPMDNWTIGYTTNVVVGVWSGNANGGNPMGHIIGVSGAGPIWRDVIEYASGRSLLGMTPDLQAPTDAFPQPSGLIKQQVNPTNGLKGTGTADWMLVNENPQQTGLPVCPAPDPNNPPDPNAPPNPNCPPPTGNPNGNSGIFGDGSNPFGY